jgi:hypothetical protein
MPGSAKQRVCIASWKYPVFPDADDRRGLIRIEPYWKLTDSTCIVKEKMFVFWYIMNNAEIGIGKDAWFDMHQFVSYIYRL